MKSIMKQYFPYARARRRIRPSRPPRAGAAANNLAHTYALSVPLALAGYWLASPIVAALGLIWIAHIGMDRMFGYGLKYATGFADTHLGRFGRN